MLKPDIRHPTVPQQPAPVLAAGAMKFFALNAIERGDSSKLTRDQLVSVLQRAGLDGGELARATPAELKHAFDEIQRTMKTGEQRSFALDGKTHIVNKSQKEGVTFSKWVVSAPDNWHPGQNPRPMPPIGGILTPGGGAESAAMKKEKQKLALHQLQSKDVTTLNRDAMSRVLQNAGVSPKLIARASDEQLRAALSAMKSIATNGGSVTITLGSTKLTASTHAGPYGKPESIAVGASFSLPRQV